MNGFGIRTIAENPVIAKLRSGKPSFGSWLTLCSPVAAEMMARVGFEWLVVDVEHSPIGFETAVDCFRAIQLGGAVPLARVPWNDTIWVQRLLDAGALGLVVPMVSTAEEARQAVSNMRYATKGQRSFGGSRVAAYIEGDYRTWADANLACIALIETAQGVENVEEILAVDGVVAAHVGHIDLALSMGIPPEEIDTNAEHAAAMLHVVEAARKAGKAAGKMVANLAEADLRLKQGFRFLALSSDAALMGGAAREMLSAVERGV